MNLRQLRYFVQVIDSGNITRAAERLNVAQTALGAQIKQLEDHLKTTLLERHSRGVQPTVAGSLLYTRALEILSLVETTEKELIRLQRSQSEPVRLGVTPALMLAAGHEIALNAHTACLEISFVEGMSHVLTRWLDDGQVDFALCYDVPDLPQFSRTPLLQDDLVLATPANGFNGVEITLAEALTRPLAMPEAGDSVRTVVFKAASALGMEPNIQYEIRSISGMKSLVQRGVASSVLPQFSILEEAAKGDMDCRPLVKPSLRRTLFLARLKKRRFQCEPQLTECVWTSLAGMVESMGPLAHPLRGVAK